MFMMRMVLLHLLFILSLDEALKKIDTVQAAEDTRKEEELKRVSAESVHETSETERVKAEESHLKFQNLLFHQSNE